MGCDLMTGRGDTLDCRRELLGKLAKDEACDFPVMLVQEVEKVLHISLGAICDGQVCVQRGLSPVFYVNCEYQWHSIEG